MAMAAPEQADPSMVPPPMNPPPVVVPSLMAPVLTHRNRSPDPCALMMVFRSPVPMRYWPGPRALRMALPQLMLYVPGRNHGVRPAPMALLRASVSRLALPVGAITAIPPPLLLSRTKYPPSELMSRAVNVVPAPPNWDRPMVASVRYGPASDPEARNEITPAPESTARVPEIGDGP